jgi:sugar-specific transcriptional regulator TrmB
MADTLDKARTLIEARIRELDDERKQLEKALSNLGGKRGPGRPRGSTSTTRRGSGGAPKRRRRRRGGTRADQALKHVTENPGIRASEIASKMNIKPNYVYRVMSELESDGKVTKKGREYHPAASAS